MQLWGQQIWVSQIVEAIANEKSLIELLSVTGGYSEDPELEQSPLTIVEGFLELDAALKLGLGIPSLQRLSICILSLSFCVLFIVLLFKALLGIGNQEEMQRRQKRKLHLDLSWIVQLCLDWQIYYYLICYQQKRRK